MEQEGQAAEEEGACSFRFLHLLTEILKYCTGTSIEPHSHYSQLLWSGPVK
jgi:hypothetical protein